MNDSNTYAEICESLMINKIEAAITEYFESVKIKDLNLDLFDDLLDTVHRYHIKRLRQVKRQLDECAEAAHELAEQEIHGTTAEYEADKIIRQLEQECVDPDFINGI